MSFLDALTNWFPLLRGRTGIEAVTRRVPVIVRLYRGPIRIVTHRTKVKCRVAGSTLYVGVSPVDIPHHLIKYPTYVDGASISFDYPLIGRIERDLPEFPRLELENSGTITLVPLEGALLTLE